MILCYNCAVKHLKLDPVGALIAVTNGYCDNCGFPKTEDEMSALGNLVAPIVSDDEAADTAVYVFNSKVDSFLEFLDDIFTDTTVSANAVNHAVTEIQERLDFIKANLVAN